MISGWSLKFLTLAVAMAVLPALIASARQRALIDSGWKVHLGDPTDITNASETNVTYYPEISDLEKLQLLDVTGPTSETNLMTLRPALAGLGQNVSFVQTDYDDTAWQAVNLPHDWVVGLPFSSGGDKGHGYKAGINGITSSNTVAWYRRTFTLPSSDTNQTISLEFDGVYRNCLVWLNGNIIGRNVSGYSSFSFDITPYANPGGTNVLVVRVDASRFEGWFYEGAGIYRHVWLVETDPIHVAHWGTYVTNVISGSNATVTIQTQVNNDSSGRVSCNLTSVIFGPNSNLVATATASTAIAAGTNQIVTQTITVTNALLWSLDFPNLYQLVSTVTQGTATNDVYDTTFGIRTVTWNTNTGLYLNGQRVEARGTCNHQDFAGIGLAMPDRIQYFRIEKLKGLGFNAIRTSHNSPTPELLDACDRLGMLVLDENRRFGDDPETLSELQRGITRDRNHPCVFAWSLANEETLQGNSTGAVIMTSMQSLAHQLDPTRLCTAAMNGSWGSGFSTVMDVQGFNYNEGGQTGYHAGHPTQPCIATEDGSQVGDRGNYTNLNSYVTAYDNFNSGVGWSQTEEGMWQYYSANSFVAGFFNWTGFDYRGEPTPTSWPTINSHFGILDTCGFPKDNAWYFQANWLSKPVLHIFPHWNWSTGQTISVWCFSSCQSVQLFLNGASLGTQTVNVQSHLQWNVPYSPGTLQAIGYINNQSVITNTVTTTGSPASISLQPDRSTILADGQDVSAVAVSILDSQGFTVPTASNTVTFTVSGNGALRGLGNGDANDHESDQATNNMGVRSAFNGLAEIIVQSTTNPGTITLTATSPGLLSTNITINTASTLPPPAIPTGLDATPNNNQVVLGWNISPGATAYNLARATNSGGPYTTIVAGTGDIGWTDTNVINGVTYYYVVAAIGPGGISTNSAEISVTPFTPFFFSAQPDSVSNSNVVYAGYPITFSASVTGVAPISYQWYEIANGMTNVIAGATNSSFAHLAQASDTNAIAFFVVAANASGSITSSPANLLLNDVTPSAAAAPISIQFAITNYSGYSGLFLSPSDIAGVYAVSNWNVWPITPGTNTTQPGITFTNLADWDGTRTPEAITVLNVSDGWHQSQSVTASSTANARMMNTYWKVNPGKSNPSVNTMLITLTNVPNGAYTAYVYLMQNVSGAEGYIAGGQYTSYFSEWTAFNASSNFVTAVDSTGTVYPLVNYIQLPALSTGGSNAIPITVVHTSGGDGVGVCGLQLVPLLTAPARLFAVVTNNQVALKWNGVFGASSYNLLRSTASGGPYTTIAGSLAQTNYTDAAVTNGVTYYYVVSAINSAGQNVNSDEVKALVPPAVPIMLTVGFSANGTLILSSPGASNQAFVLESATNLSSPIWVPLLTNGASDALFNYPIGFSNTPQSFYRIVP